MRRFYTKTMLVAIMTCCMAISAVAQTGYILTATGSSKIGGGKASIYAFDVNTPWIADEVCYTDTLEDDFGVMGCLAGDIYYAYMEQETASGASTMTFNSLNMTTGKRVVIAKGNYSLTYGIDMCYDEKTDNIYLLREEYVIENEATGEGNYVVQLCTVDRKSGEIASYATLPMEATDYNLAGITADGNGNLYIVGLSQWMNGETMMSKFYNSHVNLYSFNLQTKTFSTLFTEEESAVVKHNTAFLNSSLGLLDGKLYLTLQSDLIVLDIETKSAVLNTAKGSGEAGANDAQMFLTEAVGICFAKSTKDAEVKEEEEPQPQPQPQPQPDNRIIKVVETYGDHMGERVGQMTHKKVSLYDGENRLRREATYGLSYTGMWEIEYFGTCTYNQEGRLAMTASQKYGIYDGTDLAFVDNKDTVTYEYDEEGRKVKETLQAGGYSIAYEYDEEGRLVKETKLVPDYNNTYGGGEYAIYEITYSAFNSFGKPDSIHSTGLYDGEKYFGIYTYDEKGRQTGTHTWTLADTTDVKIETWTYNDDATNDTIMIYSVHEWFGEFDMGEKRTLQTYDNGNTNRIKEQKQSLANGTWVNDATYTITELSEMNPDVVPMLEINDAKQTNHAIENNSVVLSITLPEAAVTGTIAFDVYRHGILLSRLNMADAIDGKLTYIDEGVKNGTYDYYVQTVFINELLEIEEPLNISNVETYTHFVELPAVKEIKCTNARLEDGTYYATIEWMTPADTVGLAFQRYNVMLERMKAADNAETDGQVLTWEVNCGYTGKVNLYIQTIYKYGKANSEMISIDAQAVMDAMGIEETQTDAPWVRIDGQVLNIAKAGNVVVYNAQGIRMLEADAVTTLDLNVLPSGIYLVKVETVKGVKILKVKI